VKFTRRDTCRHAIKTIPGKGGGSARVIACIEDPVVIKKILVHLQEKLPARAALLLPDSRAPPESGLLG